MKRFLIRLTIALLTFLISLSITSTLSLFTQLQNIEVNYEADKTFSKRIEPEEIAGEIEIKYAWSLIGVDSLDGKFKITNRTNKSIYYMGTDKNSHLSGSYVKQSGEVRNAPGILCIFGLERQELRPKESVIFSIPVPQNEKPFEAGFDFKIGNEQKEQTVWTKVSKQIKSFGISCTDKIVKSGSILAESCIDK